MEKIENATDRIWFRRTTGALVLRAHAIVMIEVEGQPDTPHDPVDRRDS